MEKKHCAGCEDNFYNQRETPGFDGKTECWSLANARLAWRKRVPVTQAPPWEQPPEQRPSCFHQKGYVFVGPDREC